MGRLVALRTEGGTAALERFIERAIAELRPLLDQFVGQITARPGVPPISDADLTSATLRLMIARHELLEEETDYAAWTRYVRVLRPGDRSIVVPRRFVLLPRERADDEGIDLDAIELALGILGER